MLYLSKLIDLRQCVQKEYNHYMHINLVRSVLEAPTTFVNGIWVIFFLKKKIMCTIG